MLSAFRTLEPETQSRMRKMLSDLFSSGASEAARAILPGTFRHVPESPAPVAALVEKVKARQEELWERLRPDHSPRG